MKKYTGFVLTLLVFFFGVSMFNSLFSQPEIDIIKVLVHSNEGFINKLVLFYLFARLVTNLFVEISKPFRDKIVLIINKWLDRLL